MLVLASILGIACLGQTLVILIRGIDVSVPAYIVAGATLSIQLTNQSHWPFGVSVAAIVAGSAIAGGITGFLCHRFQADPLIVTLGTGAIVLGGIFVWVQGFVTGSPPSWLLRLSSPAGTTFGISFPPLVLVWIALAIVVNVVLYRTVVGRWLYSTGSNPRAAQLALVPTRAVWVGVFMFSSVVASLAGVVIGGFSGAGQQDIGDPYLWTGLTAVIVGGTVPGSGGGDYARSVLGSLFVIVLGTVMVGHGYSYADQQILYGILILAAVGLYGRTGRVRDRV
jgi:ribose transport system permease protein